MKNKTLISQIVFGFLAICHMLLLYLPMGIQKEVKNPLIFFTGLFLIVSIYLTAYWFAKDLEKKRKKCDSVYGIMFGAGFFIAIVIEQMADHLI